jgi:hypothetical protein
MKEYKKEKIQETKSVLSVFFNYSHSYNMKDEKYLRKPLKSFFTGLPKKFY